MTSQVPILIVDDRAENLLALEGLLAELELDLEVIRALSGNDALRQSLKQDFALVLLDVQMPDMDGFETAELMRRNPKTSQMPIIFLTAGAHDYSFQFKGYETGAVDFLAKPIEAPFLRSKLKVFCQIYQQRKALEAAGSNLDALVQERTRELCLEIQHHHLTEAALRQERDRAQSYLDTVEALIVSLDAQGRITLLNRHGCQLLGWAESELLDRNWFETCLGQPEGLGQLLPAFRAELAGAAPGPVYEESPIIDQRGLAHTIAWHHTWLRDAAGRPGGRLSAGEDITERLRLEAERREIGLELLHAQKLESIGCLAGGVAHDINNVLTAIMGMASLIEMKYPLDPFIAKAAGTLQSACGRGGNLVKGLTSFGRKQIEESIPLDLNELVRSEVALLERTTLQRIELSLDLEPGLPLIQGDPSSLANVIMNLCVNAMDAMPEGGTLRFRTRSLADARVELQLEDSGCGMPAEVQAHALTPFFTTKPVGKGTGLGLAIVYGTVKAHGGTLEIASEVGLGTRISLRFKSLEAEPERPQAEALACAPQPIRPLRILVVDDDELICATMPTLLEAMNYQVDIAPGALEAIALLEAGLRPDLVILDNNMPGMRGDAAFKRIRALRPGIPVLFSSGYPDEGLRQLAAGESRVATLDKPYILEDLRRTLNRIAAQFL